MVYRLGGLPPNTLFRLIVWNADGSGTNVDIGFVDTDSNGTIDVSVPLQGVFALTTVPLGRFRGELAVAGSTAPPPESITRSALLRRTGVAAAALAFGGATARYAFAGPAEVRGPPTRGQPLDRCMAALHAGVRRLVQRDVGEDLG